jgi:hypothetical protein
MTVVVDHETGELFNGAWPDWAVYSLRSVAPCFDLIAEDHRAVFNRAFS